MKYKILCKQVELAEKSKEKMIDRMKKLDRFFGSDEECKVCVSIQQEQMVVEITFMYKGFLIRSDARNSDLLTAVDICMENIDRQIRKNKTKLSKRLRDDSLINFSVGFDDDVKENKDEFKIIKRKRFETKPMSTEEAVLQMNMLGHDFFVYNNAESDDVEIVYKRKDGNYGLIELT